MNPRYELQGQLGEGGAGTVWKAWDKRLQRYVAIKVLLPEDRRAEGMPHDTDALIAEASVLSSLQHPNVVAVYDVEPDEELGAYVVMEYLNGENLEQIISRGAINMEDFRKIAVESLEGLNVAHRMGILHRDVKPSNIMVNWTPDGTFQTKVLDFGLAKFTARPKQQTSRQDGTSVLGSVHFMSPEQTAGRPLDQRSDLYSLGCVLYYGITGYRPFDAPSLSGVLEKHQKADYISLFRMRPDLPAPLCDFIHWLMAKQPEERPRDSQVALQTLKDVVSGKITDLSSVRGMRTQRVSVNPANVPVAVAAPKLSHTAGVPPVQKSRLPLILGGALALAGIAAGVFFATRGPKQPDGTPAAGSQAGAGGNTKEAAPAWMPPVTKGLVIHLDPEHEVMARAGDTVATVGKHAGRWNDLAPLGGKSDFYASTDQEGVDELPVRVEVKDEGGLVGTHRFLRFDGDDSMVLTREALPDHTRLASGELDSGRMTVFLFTRVTNGTSRPISLNLGGEPLALGARTDERGPAGFNARRAEGKSASSERGRPPREQFFIITGTYDPDNTVVQGRIVSAFEEKDAEPARDCVVNPPLRQIRLGAASDLKAQSSLGGDGAYHMQGELGPVLIYNRLLSPDERRQVESWLKRRYFGSP